MSRRSYRDRSSAEWLAALHAVGDLTMVRFQLRRNGYRTAVERAHSIEQRRAGDDHLPPARLARIVWVVARRVPWRTNCLDRSLALVRMMRRVGLRSVVCLGVRRVDGSLRFHAWVEVTGVVVNDDVRLVAQYQRFEGAPPAGAAIE